MKTERVRIADLLGKPNYDKEYVGQEISKFLDQMYQIYKSLDNLSWFKKWWFNPEIHKLKTTLYIMNISIEHMLQIIQLKDLILNVVNRLKP